MLNISMLLNAAPVALALAAVLALLLFLTLRDQRRTVAIVVAAFLVGALAGAAAFWTTAPALRDFLEQLSVLICGMALLSLLGMLLFRVILPGLRFASPRILQDVSVAALQLVWFFLWLNATGVNTAQLITGSAIVTAVVGFALQDTLGNILAGLALQLDHSIHVGDFIRIDDTIGRVVETRWRYTAVENGNWETVVIPNSVLMKNKFFVLGRRIGEPNYWRRWIYFNVDYRTAPAQVIEAVEKALQSAEIPWVAKIPKPHCIQVDFADSYARYAARYWLTNIFEDWPTDSEIRIHIYAALKRAGISLSIPAQAVFLTEETEERRAQKAGREVEHRANMLRGVELFSGLQRDELEALGNSLQPALFARGDILLRQGSAAHNLYIINEGTVDVLVENNGQSMKVAELGPGSFFGEMGLLTGEPRHATVIARSQVNAFRIDKAALNTVLQSRPKLADELSHILAQRRTELDALLHNMDEESRKRKMASDRDDILGKIKALFGLE